MQQVKLNSQLQILALAMLFAFAFSLFANGSAAAQEYNPRDEFALTQGGTNGLWNYGVSTSDADNTLNLFSATDILTQSSGCSGGSFEKWLKEPSGEQLPQIARHNPAATCANIPSNAVFMHPGRNNQRVVLRFNVPTSGTFQIVGAFQKQNLSTTTDLKIIKNAATAGQTVLFTGTIGAVYQRAFNFTETLAAGDKIDFSVGDGDNGQNSDGSTLAVTISQPIAACLTAPANLQTFVPGENSPVDVQSVNTNAQLVDNAAYDAGKVGKSFKFDGSGDYVRIEDNAAQRPATALTAEGWFKFDSVGSVVSLISKPVRGSTLNSYTLYTDGGQLRGLVGNASQYTRVFSNFTPQTGVWHHLAFTYNSSGGVSTLKLYANGVEVTTTQDGTTNLPLFYDANPLPLLIGGEYEGDSPGFFLNGQADEVSVYGRALAQSEIFDIVQRGGFGKCAPGASCVSAPSGLVSLYKAEDNALDSTGNAPAANNGATFSSGQVGRAFSFDGNDYVQTPTLNLGANYSLEFWMKPAASGTPRNVISNNYASTTNYGGLYFYTDNSSEGHLEYYVSNGGTANTATAIGSVLLNTWSHIGVTYDGSVTRIYVNGVLAATGAAHTETFNNPLRFGSAFNSGATFFLGSLDEISLYRRTLSAAELQSVYNSGANGKCLVSACTQTPNNLVSWFAGERNALDSRSNNHGALQGGATFSTGKVGQAFNVNETSYVAIPDNSSLDIGANAKFSLETWIKAASTSGISTIIEKRDPNDTFRGYSLYIWTDGRLGFQLNDAGIAQNYIAPAGSPNLRDGQWHHVAVTIDRDNSSGLRLYVDGALLIIFDPANSPGNLSNSAQLFIGKHASDSASNFVGLIDEVGIYSRALAASEVSAIYDAASSGKCKPVGLNSPSNQIAWFTGDGDNDGDMINDAQDFLGLNPDGILRGNANYRVGRVGQAFNLDGSGDYVEIADDADHRPATQLTAEGWFKFNNFNNIPHLIAKGLRGNDRNSYVMWFANGNIRIGYSDSGSNFIFYDTGFVPNAGEFNHYAMVLNTEDAGANANTFKLYVNGREVFNGAAAGSIYYDTVNPHPLTIGADINNDIPDFSLNGLADEVSLYSRALSVSEVAAVYNAGTAGKLKSVITPVSSGTARSGSFNQNSFGANQSNAADGAVIQPVTVKLTSATVTFAQVTGAGVTSQSGVDLALLPPLPASASKFTGLAYDISTTAVYENDSVGDVRVCFNVPSLSNFSSLQIFHLEGTVWQNRTVSRSAPEICADVSSLSPFVIAEGFVPTAAMTTISGRAVIGKSGIRNALVTLTEADGTTRTVKTGEKGGYRFDNVAVGQNVIITISAKRFAFTPGTHVLNVTESVTEIDFTAQE